METEEKQTEIVEEGTAARKKSLWPWVIGGFVFFILVAIVTAIMAWRRPLDKPEHKPTAEELEQMKYDSDQKEREQRKADSLQDQNLLIREDDSQSRFNSLMRDYDKSEKQESKKHTDGEKREEAEEEAVNHILREPPIVQTNEQPLNDAPVDSGKLPSMFVYSRAFSGARYVEPKVTPQSRNTENVEKVSSDKSVTGSNETAVATPESEKKTSVIYTGLPPVTIHEGEMLDAVLVNRLIVDTEPSLVICNLSRDLLDRSGRYVVLPANSRVIGTSQAVNYKGAHRLFITFSRIIIPGGTSIDLPTNQKAMKALDETGALGVVSKVDRHWFLQFGTSIFFGVLDGLSGAAQRNNETSLRSSVLGRTSENFDRVMDDIMTQYSTIVPTIRVEQGKTMKIYLSGDIVVSPYARVTDRSYYATR